MNGDVYRLLPSVLNDDVSLYERSAHEVGTETRASMSNFSTTVLIVFLPGCEYI